MNRRNLSKIYQVPDFTSYLHYKYIFIIKLANRVSHNYIVQYSTVTIHLQQTVFLGRLII